MELYPVLDLMGGVVVRGVAGERERYRPIQSRLVDSAEPLRVARAIRESFGVSALYVADLDAIEGGDPHVENWRELVEDGFRVFVDAGVGSARDAESTRDLGATNVVAALETLPSPRILSQVVEQLGDRSVVFSLDLKRGVPLGSPEAWSKDVERVAEAAWESGARRWILLDLAAVGVGAGTPHLERCRTWKARFGDELELWTGGGVRGVEDLRELERAGVDGVLIASAIHDGRLRPSDF